MSIFKVTEINDIFENFEHLITTDFNSNDESFVAPLSEIVTSISRDDDLKQSTFENTKWFNLLNAIFSVTPHFQQENNIVSDEYLRLIRGIFLLCRNILTVKQLNNVINNQFNLYDLHMEIIRFYKSIAIKKMRLSLNNITLELLANLTTLLPEYRLGDTLNLNLGLDIDTSTTADTLDLIDTITIFIENNKFLKNNNFSLLLYFNNLVNKNDNFIQYSLRSFKFKKIILEDFFINEELNQSFYDSLVNIQSEKKENIEELLNAKDLISLKILKKLLIHESVPTYLNSLIKTGFDNNDLHVKTILSIWIKMATILLCSINKYDSFELTNIMIWVFMFFKEFCSEVILFFKEYKIKDISVEIIDAKLVPHLDFLYEDLVNILDIISHLIQFEHCQKFLIYYKGVEQLSKLLQTLQINCFKLSVYIDGKDGNTLKLNDNLKKNENYKTWEKLLDTKENKIKSLNFPHCKSLIIEIFNKLLIIEKEDTETLDKIHKLQEQLRELGVLEITLSNCGIDDNEPFIKERCIMFLKHLLYRNSKNQDLVAKLEQRKEVDAVSESLLEDIGYEVDINDSGKIGLKKKEKRG